jgi:hypothetical protein
MALLKGAFPLSTTKCSEAFGPFIPLELHSPSEFGGVNEATEYPKPGWEIGIWVPHAEDLWAWLTA